jgi:hypothetical protein
MNDPVRIVEVERLRLTGLEATPGRAERIRGLVEAELQRLLEQGGWPDVLGSSEVSRLDAPTMHLDRPHSDSHFADGLARSIFQTLRSVE